MHNNFSCQSLNDFIYINDFGMIKVEAIYEEDADCYKYKENTNLYHLTDQQRNNINKRLPRGFCLVKTSELPRGTQFKGEVQYIPTKRQPRVASEDLNKQFLAQPMISSQNFGKDNGKSEVRVDKSGLRFSQLPEGKSKHAQKIKNILQRFRRHYRYSAFSQYLTRMGFSNTLIDIQNQNKKNIHTIDSFKDRMMILFKYLKDFTYQQTTISMLNQLVDEFLFHVQQARKLQFQSSLNSVQKSIDKVTRQISEIRQSGNFYYRKKKRNEKNYDEKELLYISELIKMLPKAYLVGVMEIIEEKPFQEITAPVWQFHINDLKHKKIREIEFYVKKKLSNYFKSRQRKRDKMQKRKAPKGQKDSYLKKGQVKLQDEQIDRGQVISSKSIQNLKQQMKAQNEINYIFQFDNDNNLKNDDHHNQDRSLFGFDDGSRNDFDDYLPQRQSELFFDGGSVQNPSVIDKHQKEENVEFQQMNIVNFGKRIQQERDYDSSDSSMITDEEDSEY